MGSNMPQKSLSSSKTRVKVISSVQNFYPISCLFWYVLPYSVRCCTSSTTDNPLVYGRQCHSVVRVVRWGQCFCSVIIAQRNDQRYVNACTQPTRHAFSYRIRASPSRATDASLRSAITGFTSWARGHFSDNICVLVASRDVYGQKTSCVRRCSHFSGRSRHSGFPQVPFPKNFLLTKWKDGVLTKKNI